MLPSKRAQNSVLLLATQCARNAANLPFWIMLFLPMVLVALSACHKEAEAVAPEVRPVRTITVARQAVGETVVLTGHIEAENEAALAFRISGRMTERPVNIG